LKNPITGLPIESFYLSNETWNQKFAAIASSYEECRADTIGIYLGLEDDCWELFYPDQKEKFEDFKYV